MKYLYQFVVFRIVIALSRYFLFTTFKKFKTLYDPQNKEAPNITIYNVGKTGLSHNLVYRSFPKEFSLNYEC